MGGYGVPRIGTKYRPAISGTTVRRNAFLAGLAARRMAQTAAARRAAPRFNGVVGVRQRFYPGLRRANKTELNYVDLAFNSYVLNTTGSITLIATIAQGTTVNQRVGKKAFLKSLLLRGFVTAGTTGTTADATTLIIYDKRPTGALPAITDILTSANSIAFMNDNNTSRFRVLRRYDWCLIGNSTTPATGAEQHNLDEFIKINLPITFEAAGTGAIGDIDSGALYLVTVGSVAAGTAAPTLGVACRTRFTE